MVVDKVSSELKKNIDKKYHKTYLGFFKNDDTLKMYGVRYPIVRVIANKHFKESVNKLSKKEVFKVCEDLMNSRIQEEIVVAFEFAENCKQEFVKEDLSVFKKWIEKYVVNWGLCDDICSGPLGEILIKYPELISETRKWYNSSNRWLKRASIVSLIKTVQKTKKVDDVYKVADLLLSDRDDLIQKATGWTLREAGKKDMQRLHKYVNANKSKMGRTCLRYSIEKFDANERKKLME